MFSVPMSLADARAEADGLTISESVPEWIAAPTDVAAKVAATIDQLKKAEAKTTEVKAPKADGVSA